MNARGVTSALYQSIAENEVTMAALPATPIALRSRRKRQSPYAKKPRYPAVPTAPCA